MSQDSLPIGDPLPGWTARPDPPAIPMTGRFCRVEPLDPRRHAADLFRAFAADPDGRMWRYMAYGPFATEGAYRDWLESSAGGRDPLFHAIVDLRTGRAAGVAAWLRIDPANGVLELGHIALSPGLQRTAAATEAVWLMLRRAFTGLGYRRCEWKCDALNAASCHAARRFGFSYEGTFRQAAVYKGRNRDTAWFAIIDKDWPELDRAFRAWLDPANFDATGRQRDSLAKLRERTSGPSYKNRRREPRTRYAARHSEEGRPRKCAGDPCRRWSCMRQP
jgi:RimJ/RimL family protein N-acetyltransferase